MPALSNWRLAQLCPLSHSQIGYGAYALVFQKGAPLRIPQIEIKMVDEPHLAAPLHVGVLGLLLSLLLPRAPGRGFLLSNPNQDHLAIAALFGRGAQQRLSDLLLVFFL